MSHQDDIDQAADALRDSVNAGAAGNVDDIIDEIIGGSGAYSRDFHDMASRYGADEDEDAEGRPTRRFPRRDYSAEAEESIAAQREMESRISRKMAPSVRDTVNRETQNAVRPEFTPDGAVRYPSRGVGESGERVVYDADWEQEAKEEAARLDRFSGTPERGEGTPPARFRITGADELPPRSASRSGQAKPAGTPADAPRAQGRPAADVAADNAAFYEAYLNGVKSEPAPPEEEAPAGDIPFERRGLSPEAQTTVDNAVLEAFSSDFTSDEAFKNRWRDTVERAQRLKERKAREAQEAEARERSRLLMEEKERQVAQMEENMEINPPPAQKGRFTITTPPGAVREIGKEGFGEVPAAEHLDEETAEKTLPARTADRTIPKTPGEKFAFFMKTHFSKQAFARFMRTHFPAKGDSTKEKVRKVVRAVSFVALVCALVYLLIYYINYRNRVSFIDNTDKLLDSYDSMTPEELENAWASMRAKYPDVQFPEGMNIKFAELYAVNSDVVGWLEIPHKESDSPKIRTVLLQSRYTDFYLYRDIYKKYSRYGNPYLQPESNMGIDGPSKNTIIYGHNTHDHLIFNRLEEYMTVQGYLNAPIIVMDTLYKTTKWKIFAVMLTNAEPEDDNGNVFDYLYTSFYSNEAFLAKMKQIQARSMIHTGVDVQATDRTLMLYTCYRYKCSSGRLVIVARELREGESEEINSSLVYYDSGAIFPAAYYGKRSSSSTTAAPAATSAQSAATAAPTEAPAEAPEPAATPAETPADAGEPPADDPGGEAA